MMRATVSFLLLLVSACAPVRRETEAAQTRVEPAQVILIRHAEKPEKGPELSPKGRDRAAALVKYFLENPEVTKFGTPVAIYAQKPTADRHSKRSVDTVVPLAAKLNQEIRQVDHDDAAKMVQEIKSNPKYAGKMVLVCWQHEALTDIAKMLGVTDAPDWKGKVFDRTWIITFPQGGPPALKSVPQKVLEGDSQE